jgi:putative ABC transport system substrate-binding protein
MAHRIPGLIVLVILVLGFLLTSFSADAQQVEKVPRIGVLEVGSPPTPNLAAFRHGLHDLGYVEGQNLILEYRYAEGRFERLPDLAAELVHLKVDVLVTSGSQPVQELRHATSTIPIVGVILADPVETGFAASFAQPGGSITGLAFQNADLSTKRLELLKEAVPGITQVAVLWDSHNPASANAVRATQEAARSLGVTGT